MSCDDCWKLPIIIDEFDSGYPRSSPFVHAISVVNLMIGSPAHEARSRTSFSTNEIIEGDSQKSNSPNLAKSTASLAGMGELSLRTDRSRSPISVQIAME
jgi:hypothetical protein